MSGLYTRLAANVLFPLHERLKGHDTVAVKQHMEASQWWPLAQLQQYQNQRLQNFYQSNCYHGAVLHPSI